METTLDVDKACVDIVDPHLRIEKTTCNVDKAHVVDVVDAPLKIEKMAFEADKACADVADVPVKTLKRSNSARENKVDDNEARKLDLAAAKVNKTSPMGKGASESSPPKFKTTTSGPEVKGASEPSTKKAVEVPSSASSYSAHVDTGRRGSIEHSDEKQKDKKDHPPSSRRPAVDDKATDKPDSRISKEKKRKSEPSPRDEPASKKRASEKDSPRSKKSASKGSSHRLPKTDSTTAEHKQPLPKQEKTKSEKSKKGSRKSARKAKEEIILDPKERERLKSEALEKARKESGDCIKVKTPDRKKEISWPMSLIRYTNSKPFISYGCNPIYGKIGIAVAKEKGPVKSNSEVKEEKKEIQEALKEPAKKGSRSREHKPKKEGLLVAPVENKALSPPKEVVVKESEVTDVVSPDLNTMSGLQALQCLYDNMDSPETAAKEVDSETEVSHREADLEAVPEETPPSDQCESVESDATGQHWSVVESAPPSPEALDAKQPSKSTPPRTPPERELPEVNMEVSSKPQTIVAEETKLLLNKTELTAEPEVSVEIVERERAQEHQLDVISPASIERAQEEVGLPETEKKGDMPSPNAMDVADDVVDLLSNSDVSLEEMRLLEYSSRIIVESPAIIESAPAETVESVAEDSQLQEEVAIKADPPTEEVAVAPSPSTPSPPNEHMCPEISLVAPPCADKDLTSEYEKFMEQLNLGSCIEVDVAQEVEVPSEDGVEAEQAPDAVSLAPAEGENELDSVLTYPMPTPLVASVRDEASEVPVEDIGALEVACESEVTSSPFSPSVPPPPAPVPAPTPAIASTLGAVTSYISPIGPAVPDSLASCVLAPIGSTISTGIPIVPPLLAPAPCSEPVAPVAVEAPPPVPAPAVSAATPTPVPVTSPLQSTVPHESFSPQLVPCLLAATSAAVPVSGSSTSSDSSTSIAHKISSGDVPLSASRPSSSKRSHRKRHSDSVRASTVAEDVSPSPPKKKDSKHHSSHKSASQKPDLSVQQEVSSSRSAPRPIIIKVQANSEPKMESPAPQISQVESVDGLECLPVEQMAPDVCAEVEVGSDICTEEQVEFPSSDDMFVTVMDTEDISLAAVEEVACSSSDDLNSSLAVPAEQVEEKESSPPPPPPPPRYLRLKPRKGSSSSSVSSSSSIEEVPPPPPPPPPRPPVRCLVLPPPPAGILLPAGRGTLSNEPKKSVTFADGISPGKEPPSSGGVPSPPPPPPPPPRERKHRTKVKVIIPSSVADSLPPPPPPPKRPPPPTATMLPVSTAATVVTTAAPAPPPVAVETVAAAYPQYQVHLPQQAYATAGYTVPYNTYPAAGYAYTTTTHLGQTVAYTYAPGQATHQAMPVQQVQQVPPQQHLYANATAASYVYHPHQIVQAGPAVMQQQLQQHPPPPPPPPMGQLPPRPPT